jgi:hypothetical protein
MDSEGDKIRKLMAAPPHPQYAGRSAPTAEQLSAIEKHLLERGFHQSVAAEMQTTAQLLGVDKALDEISKLERSYPATDGVPGTAALPSRQYYYDQLEGPKLGSQIPGGPGMQYRHKRPYPEHMRQLPQKGTKQPFQGNPKQWGQARGQ